MATTKEITSMKTRRVLYTIIGSLLIGLNLLTDLAAPDRPYTNTESEAYNTGYLIGSHFLAIIGLILLLIAFRLHRKLKRSGDKSEIERSIEEFGKDGEV